MAKSSNVIPPAYLSESKIGSEPDGRTNSAVAIVWKSIAGKALRSGDKAWGPPVVSRLKGSLYHSASCLSKISRSSP